MFFHIFRWPHFSSNVPLVLGRRQWNRIFPCIPLIWLSCSGTTKQRRQSKSLSTVTRRWSLGLASPFMKSTVTQVVKLTNVKHPSICNPIKLIAIHVLLSISPEFLICPECLQIPINVTNSTTNLIACRRKVRRKPYL